MPNQPIVTAGLVLRETVTRETDKILTVLTPDRGKISLIARGARRKNSRLAAACQLLAYSELTIYCEKASHKGIIIGKHGDMLKRISTLARQDIEKFMGTKVYLETWVKVKENWRDNVNFIRSQGYNEQ